MNLETTILDQEILVRLIGRMAAATAMTLGLPISIRFHDKGRRARTPACVSRNQTDDHPAIHTSQDGSDERANDHRHDVHRIDAGQ